MQKELAPPFKSLLQEFCLKQGFCLPIYETSSTGPSHLPIFTSIVEVDGKTFEGKPAKSKKQAEVLAAELAWSTLIKSTLFLISILYFFWEPFIICEILRMLCSSNFDLNETKSLLFLTISLRF